MKPLDDWLLVEPENTGKDTKITLPDNIVDSDTIHEHSGWIVKAVGDKVREGVINVGDIVMPVGMPVGFRYNDNKYWAIKDADIGFIIENKDKGPMFEIDYDINKEGTNAGD